MTTDPIGELIEAAKDLEQRLSEMEKAVESVCLIASIHGCPYSGPTWTGPREMLEIKAAAVEQMRRDVKRPKVYMDDEVAWCLASDVREVLDLLLGGTK